MGLRDRIAVRLAALRWQDWFYAAAATNFVLCGIFAALIGGEALTGHSVSGHDFLNNHGRFKEVGHATFLFSQVYTFITLGLFLIAALFRAIVRKRRQDEEKARARRVRSRYRWQS